MSSQDFGDNKATTDEKTDLKGATNGKISASLEGSEPRGFCPSPQTPYTLDPEPYGLEGLSLFVAEGSAQRVAQKNLKPVNQRALKTLEPSSSRNTSQEASRQSFMIRS